jgi:hypothetical protein
LIATRQLGQVWISYFDPTGEEFLMVMVPASDSLLASIDSHAFHKVIGCEDTERVVFFRKSLQIWLRPLMDAHDTAACKKAPE